MGYYATAHHSHETLQSSFYYEGWGVIYCERLVKDERKEGMVQGRYR